MTHAIYEPKGRAREYAELACNLRLSCSHACTYCFGPAMLHKSKEDFCQAGPPRPGILEALERDCKRMADAGDKRRILLSFIGDVYAPEERADETTRRALEIIAAHGLNASVLTKGGLRAARDFDIMLKAGVWFGTTLTCQGIGESMWWEPHAALPDDRKGTIRYAHESGIFTWVSLEPVLYPEDALSFISELADYVDYWHVGKWNYDARANEIDWENFGHSVCEALTRAGADYRLKDSLAEHVDYGWATETRPIAEKAATVAANQEGVL